MTAPSARPATTKFNYWKLWTLALDGITSASTVPLRVWSYVGGAVALVALGYAGFIVVAHHALRHRRPRLRVDDGRGAVPRRGAAVSLGSSANMSAAS